MSKRKFKLADLERRIKVRAKASAKSSYTRQLLDRGILQCAKKFGEEAVETGLAAMGESRKRLTAETADMFYHLLVMLRARNVALADVEAELSRRQAKSGLAEKASRKKPRRKTRR